MSVAAATAARDRVAADAAPAVRSGASAWLATAVVVGATLALYLAFAGYGFNLDDEGTVLFQILRTHRGERPYLDFHTGYTPAMFYLNAALFALFGVSALPIRVVLALVNALAAGLVMRLALRLAPIPEAACAALAYALCMPFFAGQFASFNIPYPAWYAVAAWLGAELASLRAATSGRRGWLALAGVASGVAFSFKPNTGVLCLGAAALSHLLAAPPAAGWLGAALESAVLAIACVAAAAVLGFEVASVKFALLAAPLVAMLAAAIPLRLRERRAGGVATRPVAAPIADAVALLVAFLAVNAAWMLLFLPQLGLGGFARDVLLLGAGVERIYGLLYPEPSLWSLLAVAILIAAAALPAAIERGLLGRRALLLLGVGAIAGMVAAAARLALAPEGLVVSIAMQIENASFFVLPLILAAGVLRWLLGARSPAWTVALVYGLLLFIQVYPRIDFMHVVISMPSALVVAAAALRGVELRWIAALGQLSPRRPDVAGARARPALAAAVRAIALVPIAIALLSRAAAFADARLRWAPEPHLRPMTGLGSPALPVSLERDRDRDLRELRRVARFVARETRPGDAVFAFPALAIVPFLTDRRTPFPHDYFFPGRPSHADEAAMVAQLEADPPPLVVTLNDRLGYFSASHAYYFILRDHVQREFALVRRFGRFDVLMRRDLLASRPDLLPPRASGGGLSAAFAQGDYRERVREARAHARSGVAADLAGSGEHLADVDRLVRRARVLAILEVAARTPGGLGEVAATAAPDRRSRLLLLRALGEFADARALPYLLDVYGDDADADPRVAREASTAINYVLARELAARYGFAGPPDGPLWDVPGELLDEARVAELGDFDRRQRIGAITALAAAAAGRTDLAPALEPVQHPSDSSWWRMVAAFALARLGHGEATRTMLLPMRDGTLAEQYVPSMLLDPTLFDPAATSALVAELLRTGTPSERETAAWMAPFVAVPVDRAALEAAAGDADPAVRHAARWALAREGGGGR